MVKAKHVTAVAVLLIAACLSGCGYATLDSDTTASLNSSAGTPIKRAPPATPSASTGSPSTTSDKTSAVALNSTTEAAATSIGSPPNAAEKVIEAIAPRPADGLRTLRLIYRALGEAEGAAIGAPAAAAERQHEAAAAIAQRASAIAALCGLHG